MTPWLVWVGCAETPPAPPASLVLVTLDDARADHFSSYGFAKYRTPVLDELAAGGVRFDRAFTSSPGTSAAHASILSGLYPPAHGVRIDGQRTLPNEVVTLAERLRDAGFATAASIGAAPLTEVWGYDQGFDLYYDDLPATDDRWVRQRPGTEVVQELQEHLAELPADRRVFLWLHLYDANPPYIAPPLFQNRDPYDGELAFMEGQISWFKSVLDKAEPRRPFAWIVVGDHGEGLPGDRERGHGVFLDPATTRVPFVVRPAEPLAAPVVVGDVVSVVDVVPTALGLLGLPPADGLDGVDLLGAGALTGRVDRGPVYVEAEEPRVRWGFAPEVAVVDEGGVWFGTPHGGWFDPDEGWSADGDASGAHADAVRAARAFADAVRAHPVVGPSEDLGALPIELDLLAAGPAGAVDAKDRAADIDRLRAARDAAADPASRAEAADAWRELLEADPRLFEARLGLVRLALEDGRPDEAARWVEEGLAGEAEGSAGWLRLLLERGRMRLDAGRMAEAEGDARQLLARVPDSRAARDLLLSSLRVPDALAQLATWQQAAPDDAFLHAKNGQILLLAQRLPEARSELQLAAQAPVPWIGVHRGLAALAMREGDLDTTWKELSAEVALYPDDLAARHALGDYLRGRGRWDQATQLYEALLARYPGDRVARAALAEIHLRGGDLAGAEALLAPLLPTDVPSEVVVWVNLLRAKGDTAQADRVLARVRRP